MALPVLLQKLFRNGGYGPLLKDEIVDRHISIQDWSSTYDYPVNTLVRGSDGVLYWSVAQSGPGVAAGVQDPTADNGTYWGAMPAPTLGVGDIANKIATTAWVDNYLNSVSIPPDIYIDCDNGDDNNDGRTSQTPIKTPTKLYSILRNNISYNSNFVTVHVGAGDYASQYSDQFVFTGMKLPIKMVFASGSIINRVDVGSGSSVTLTGNATIRNRIAAYAGGSIVLGDGFNESFTATFTTTGLPALIRADSGGSISQSWEASVSIICSNCSVTSGTLTATTLGSISKNGSPHGSFTFSGTVTGNKYNIGSNSVIVFGSSAAIPGTAAGVAVTGAQFV